MAQTVIGFFEHESDAQKAIQRLQEMGISRNQVDLSRGSGNMGTTGSSTGMGSNAGLGSGTSMGSSNADRNDDNAVTRFFKNLFGDDNDDADRYASVGNQGYSIVTVHANSGDDAERAADILDDCGAVDVDETAGRYSQGISGEGSTYTGASQLDETAGSYGSRQNLSDEGTTYGETNRGENDRDVTIPKIQEELQVGKRTVEGGRIRVRSRIVERPVEESVRLREEHVRVDRQPVNRPVSDADSAAFQEQDIELTERSEVPVVNKEARVVEEVRISKDVSERQETVRDTVRNTEVDIDENNNRGNISNDDDLSSGNTFRADRGNMNRGNTTRNDDDDLI